MTFEDFQIGQSWVTPTATVTEGLVMEFARLTGDTNPLHTDPVAARKGLFGKPVAHGLLVVSTVFGLWDCVGLVGVALSGFDKIRFLKPVFFADRVCAKLLVTALQDRGRYGLVVLHNEVINHKGETVLVFDARLAACRGGAQ